MKIQEELFLAIGLISTALVCRNFFYMLTSNGIILVEPNTTIASIEFLFALYGAIGLFVMLLKSLIDMEKEA